MQKGSVQLLLLLLIVFLTGVGIYFYRTPKGNSLQTPKLTVQKQSEFIDYSNKDLGFELKYAKNLNLKTDSEEEFNKRGNGDFRKNFKGYVGYEPGSVLGAVVVLGKDGQYDTNVFSLWIFNNDNNLAIQQWFDKYWYYPFMWGVFDYTSKGHIALDKEATVSGQAAKYKVVDYQPGKPKFMYISKNQKMYLFRIIGDSGGQILSSLKFLK